MRQLQVAAGGRVAITSRSPSLTLYLFNVLECELRTIRIYCVGRLWRRLKGRVARLFLLQRTKMGKIFLTARKYTKMAIKYTSIFHCKTLQNLPKV
jgi:hypothetical protein